MCVYLSPLLQGPLPVVLLRLNWIQKRIHKMTKSYKFLVGRGDGHYKCVLFWIVSHQRCQPIGGGFDVILLWVYIGSLSICLDMVERSILHWMLRLRAFESIIQKENGNESEDDFFMFNFDDSRLLILLLKNRILIWFASHLSISVP